MKNESLKGRHGEIQLKDIILKVQGWGRHISNSWLVILIFIVLGGIAGFAYAKFAKPTYTAVSTFVVEEDSEFRGLSRFSGLASLLGMDISATGGDLFEGGNLLELYKSRSMVKQTLLSPNPSAKSELLIDAYINFKGLRAQWKDDSLRNINFRLERGKQFNRLQDSILSVVIDDINDNQLKVTKPDPGLSIIEVEMKSKNEAFAKHFNDQIVRNVNDFYTQTKTKKSLKNIALLQKRTDSLLAVVNNAPESNAEINKTILAELVKNLELAKISLEKEEPLIQVVDQPFFPLKTNKIGVLSTALIGALISGVCVILILLIRKIVSELLEEDPATD